MALVLSVVDFSAVADRNDDDRGAFLNEHHTPIADPKAATTAALEPLHIARSVRSVGVSLASIRLRMSADNLTHCRVAAEVKAIFFMLSYRI
jgi:hypothetical protein